ncbi:MAG: hypothetical protein WD030_08110 [Pirellulales bacterium]
MADKTRQWCPGYLVHFDEKDEYAHWLGGADPVGAECQSCFKPMPLLLSLDTRDPRLNLADLGVDRVALCFCLRCELEGGSNRPIYLLKSENEIEIIGDGWLYDDKRREEIADLRSEQAYHDAENERHYSECYDVPQVVAMSEQEVAKLRRRDRRFWRSIKEIRNWDAVRMLPTTVPEQPICLELLPEVVQRVFDQFNSGEEPDEADESATQEIIGGDFIGPIDQVGGRSYMLQRIDDPICEACNQAETKNRMWFLAGLCGIGHTFSALFLPQEAELVDMHVVFFFCPVCGSVRGESFCT